MKKIRRPLTDINGNDFMTGEKVEQEIVLLQDVNKADRIEKWLIQKIKESQVDGRIYVEGLGYVKVGF